MKLSQVDLQAIDALELMARFVNGALALRIGRDIERWATLTGREKLSSFRGHRALCEQCCPLLKTKDRIWHAEEALAAKAALVAENQSPYPAARLGPP